MNILGIESSCDETSVAVYTQEVIKSNLISSQDFHVQYGGVVPELSSRAHIQRIVPLTKSALEKAKLNLNQIDAIAATAGPGLIGALLVGFTFAKGLAYSLNIPFIPVNHIEGHIFSGFLMDEKPEFPFLVLVVSGGHTLLLLVESFLKIRKLGSTIDDAAGEAFDKVAKMLGLGYPGGPKVQKTAQTGDQTKISFPVADVKGEFDFSFSGLKTSVLRYIQKKYGKDTYPPEEDLPDICASFQFAVVKALLKSTRKGVEKFDVNSLSLVGGVAANSALRTAVQDLGNKYGKKVIIPSMNYCGDNAAMIAFRGATLLREGLKFSLECDTYPNLSSDWFS